MASSTLRTPVTLRLPFAPSSVSVARHSMREWMTENGGSGETVEDARVVVSELVGNSVRHAKPLPDGSLVVSWGPDGDGVEITVTDGGSLTIPRQVQAPSSALAGRGMAIVDTLCRSWWTEREGARTTVHATLAL